MHLKHPAKRGLYEVVNDYVGEKEFYSTSSPNVISMMMMNDDLPCIKGVAVFRSDPLLRIVALLVQNGLYLDRGNITLA